MLPKTMTGRQNGKHYTLVHDQLKNQGEFDDRRCKVWRWFLTVDNEYVGDFETKKEALSTLI